MRYLIFTLVFLYVTLSAKSWISESDLTKCHNGEPYTVYTKDKGGMYEVTGKSCDTHTIQDVEVNGTPHYGKINSTICEGEAECGYIIQDKIVNEVTVSFCPEGYQPTINKDYTEAYCATNEPIYYDKKIEKQLLPDQSLIDAKAIIVAREEKLASKYKEYLQKIVWEEVKKDPEITTEDIAEIDKKLDKDK